MKKFLTISVLSSCILLGSFQPTKANIYMVYANMAANIASSVAFVVFCKLYYDRLQFDKENAAQQQAVIQYNAAQAVQ